MTRNLILIDTDNNEVIVNPVLKNEDKKFKYLFTEDEATKYLFDNECLKYFIIAKLCDGICTPYVSINKI